MSNDSLKRAIARSKDPEGYAGSRIMELLGELEKALDGKESEFVDNIIAKLTPKLEAWQKKTHEHLMTVKLRAGDRGPVGDKGEPGRDAHMVGPKGEQGNQGAQGPAGMNGENGKDAIIDKKELETLIMEAVKELTGKKKIGVSDIVGLPETIKSMRDLSRNFGGHGGTMHKITATSLGNANYRLSRVINPAEIYVYVGGARLFDENGDFSFPAGGHISQITLAAQFDAQVQSGAALNVRGK